MIARRKKAITWFSILFGMIILLTLLLGLIIFPRPGLPPIISDDTCSRYNIRFDGTSIEAIYHAPESILADPQAFRQNDPAYLLLGEHRARVNDPFLLDAWLNNIQVLANRPVEKRDSILSALT